VQSKEFNTPEINSLNTLMEIKAISNQYGVKIASSKNDISLPGFLSLSWIK
jgi:hypothetical protein